MDGKKAAIFFRVLAVMTPEKSPKTAKKRIFFA
jgi:hypothetical protein